MNTFLERNTLMLETVNNLAMLLNDFLWNWPLIIIFFVTATIITIALRFVQIRYFFTAWKLLLLPGSVAKGTKGDMTPFQAFINALSSSLGNGSIGGMATAVYAGGPGAAVWMFVFGLFSMAIRYCEVYLSTAFGVQHIGGGLVGGPMVYLSKVPGKKFLPYLYALFCFAYALITGNAMQANTIQLGFVHIFGIQPLIIAVTLLLFMLYVVFGGAKRIVKVSDAIVPVKVGVFFISACIVLVYHYAQLLPALMIIFKAGLTPSALAGGAFGYTVQQAIRFGTSRTLNATEAGLGTAAVIFGGSGSTEPAKDGIMSMLGTFISANLVCFSIALMLVASGVWNNGKTSLDLTISAYETVFGSFGGWIVTFLSVSFGLGVLVAYAYIARNCWLFLTKGNYLVVGNLIFCSLTFLGALVKVDLVWNLADIISACLLMINIFAIVWLLPYLKKGLAAYANNK